MSHCIEGFFEIDIVHGLERVFKLTKQNQLINTAVKVGSVVKVEPYLILWSFFKLKYLKTELNVNNSTYAIVYLTSHSYRIMINLSIIYYFELMWHPLPTYLAVFRFLAKCQRLTLSLYHLIIHVFGKVQGPT